MKGKQNYFKAAIFMLLTLLGFKALQLLIYCGLNTFRSTIALTIIGTMTACFTFKKYFRRHFPLHVVLISLLSGILTLIAIFFGEAYTLFIVCDGDITLGQSITQIYNVLFNQAGIMDIFDKEMLIKTVDNDLNRGLVYAICGTLAAIIITLISNIKEMRAARAQKEAELQSIIAPPTEKVVDTPQPVNQNAKYESIIVDLSQTINEYKFSNEKAKFKQALKEFYHRNVDTLTQEEKQNLTQFAFEYGKDNAYNPNISKACSLLVKYAQ